VRGNALYLCVRCKRELEEEERHYFEGTGMAACPHCYMLYEMCARCWEFYDVKHLTGRSLCPKCLQGELGWNISG